jgi:hypothetical protein
MNPSPEQTVREYRAASAALRKKYNTPAKARQFLLKVGILEKHAGSKNGVRLAEPYRDE